MTDCMLPGGDVLLWLCLLPASAASLAAAIVALGGGVSMAVLDRYKGTSLTVLYLTALPSFLCMLGFCKVC